MCRFLTCIIVTYAGMVSSIRSNIPYSTPSTLNGMLSYLQHLFLISTKLFSRFGSVLYVASGIVCFVHPVSVFVPFLEHLLWKSMLHNISIPNNLFQYNRNASHYVVSIVFSNHWYIRYSVCHLSLLAKDKHNTCFLLRLYVPLKLKIGAVPWLR